jgi:hypothetical protein
VTTLTVANLLLVAGRWAEISRSGNRGIRAVGLRKLGNLFYFF